MSVYVDEMIPCVKSAKWHYDQSCHLVADSVEELHYFAGRMMLKPAWFQDKPELPHYDLTTGMRKYAISLGAIEINRNKISELMQMYRSKCAGQ